MKNFKCVEGHIPNLAYSLLEPWLSRCIRNILKLLILDIVLAIKPIAGVIVDRIEVLMAIDDH